MQAGLASQALMLEELLISGKTLEAWNLIKASNAQDINYYRRQAARFHHITTRRSSTPLRLFFDGFWHGFVASESPILNIIQYAYRLHGSTRLVDNPEEADVAIYSCFPQSHPQEMTRHCTRILFLGENVKPCFGSYDYSLSSNLGRLCSRNMYFPVWLYEILSGFAPLDSMAFHNLSIYDLSSIIVESYYARHKGSLIPWDERSRTPVFVGSNYEPFRLELLHHLDKYGFSVDIYGSGHRPISDKIALLGARKVNVCPENSYSAGYITEKLIQAIVAGCKALYWGGLPQSAVNVLRESGSIIVDESKPFSGLLKNLIEADFLANPPTQELVADYIRKALRITLRRLLKNLSLMLGVYGGSA